MARSAAPVLTPQSENFPQWYQDLLNKAELAENGPVRGTMVIRPFAYAVWELMQADMDARIKAADAENVYMPMFIPESYLSKEAEHVEGFSPELAVVTHAGGSKLDEPVVVRPTSETVFGVYMAKWIQSYRDLPLLLNQWCNVVRWELRPRMFLRTTEFLWQEGHTAHATREDASAYATTILHEVYARHMRDALAVPVITGIKPASERFAGAINTMACEAMMRDGKALQMGTSHELGQNFANAFDIGYLGEDGVRHACWTTSWGTSTRMLGGLIMAHGDDRGLRLPPRVAPTQAVVLVARSSEKVDEVAASLVADLKARGVRARLDDRSSQSFGRRVTEWELKGIPLRIELGPRDIEAGHAVVARRDQADKLTLDLSEVATAVPRLLDEIQAALLDDAADRQRRSTAEVTSVDEALAAAEEGWASIPWSVVREAEDKLRAQAVTVRCLVRADGSVPDHEDEPDLVAIVGRSY
jgi:prolyl-tRNA synthetase